MFFSVIVPVYNVEQYLQECVNSILSQTFSDYELILVDDGSKDTSGLICDEYAAKDARVKVIHKENGGQSTARNAGLNMATGKFAVFLDSDDFICKDYFFADLYAACSDDTDVIAYKYYKYCDGRQEECVSSLAGIDESSKASIIEELVRRDAFFCSCWSKIVRLELLKQHNLYFNENLSCEDMDWYYAVVSHAEAFQVIDKAYICYRQRAGSVTSVFKEKSITDYIYTLKKWGDALGKIEDTALKSTMLSSLAKLYCNLLISYARHPKELRHLKSQIFSFQYLLAYNQNPRTRLIGRCSNMLGLHLTCFLLRVYDKIR